MSNPFLFDEPEEAGEVQADSYSNPFLQETAVEDEYVADNPFLSQQAKNPFFVNEDEAAPQAPQAPQVLQDVPEKPLPEQIDSAMSFFGTTITDGDDDEIEPDPQNTSDDNKKPPPPRPTPPSCPQATQELISTLADHLDQTSSHLLGRIPATRTPSPVSMRDLHSPSPTPEVADLLDVSENLPEDVNENDGLLISNESAGYVQTDNPFAGFDDSASSTIIPEKPPVPDILTQAKVGPPGGPPARPPRPTPPRRSSPPNQNVLAQELPQVLGTSKPNEPDLFDMFGTNEVSKQQQNVPKSNQDILSLFSAPQKSAVPTEQPDLLTSDIFSMPNVDTPPSLPDVFSDVSAPPSSTLVTAPEEVLKIAVSDSANVAHTHAISTPTEEPEIVSAVQVNEPPLDFTAEIDKCDSLSDNSSAVGSTMSRTPEVSTPFYVPGGYIENRGQTPVSHDEIAFSYNHDVTPNAANNPFGSPEEKSPVINHTESTNIIINKTDEFDAFSAKFNSAKPEPIADGFGSGYKSPAPPTDAWGAADSTGGFGDSGGFGNEEEGFDSFLAMQAPPESQVHRNDSHDSDEPGSFNVVIRPKLDASSVQTAPSIAPPPRPPNTYNDVDSAPRPPPPVRPLPLSEDTKTTRTDSQESPSTPLFDDDVSQPLEDFPRINYIGDGWEIQLRQPTKKKITGQRFWKKCFLRIAHQGDNPVVQIFNSAKDKDPFQELPLQGCYSVSDISAQPFDQFGKIFTLKLQYIFYKERPGVRPGQVTKAERLTTKLSQFAAYAIQGDYQGVKEFGSDLKKLGLPVEHAPQVSQLFKIGSHNFEDLKQFSVVIEEHLFKFNVHRDRALTYKSEEVQLTAVDELYVEQDAEGHILKQIARVRLFFLGFLSGMPTIELGVNDMWRQGKEVVGRHDIIPVVTEEWIRLEGVEFHLCVQQNEYERTRTIRFQPPDACYIELMRFRIRPPKNRELPLQLKATWCVTGNKVELRADILVPGFASRKLGQIPCEDVAIRFPIPECWIYLFRVEKHFRYGSVKSAHRRTGKIKGIERILGTMDQLQESLIEVTSGQAKYEHHHRAIVWRCPRLPKEGQGAYTTHQLVVRMALTSYDQIPEQLAPYCYVEFTMPATQASHVTVRSVSVQDSENDDPPEKYVRYLARHEYRVGIEHTQGQEQNAYLAATTVKKEPIKEEPPAPAALPPVAGSDSDSDSN